MWNTSDTDLLGTRVPNFGALWPMLLGAGDGEVEASALFPLDYNYYKKFNVELKIMRA